MYTEFTRERITRLRMHKGVSEYKMSYDLGHSRGYVNNISEFTGKGKSFQTMFRNIETFKPARYLEGKDTENGFEMVDCIFGSDGNIVRIKRYSNKKEVNIEYTEKTKNITVKAKNN